MSVWLAMSLAASSSQLSAADLGNAISPSDYPEAALRGDRSFAALIEIVATTNGSIRNCSVISRAGSEKFAQTICKTLRNKKVRPARFADGTYANSIVRTLIKMFVPGGPDADAIAAMKQPNDLELKVSALPGGVAQQEGELTLAIGPDGAVQDCLPHGAPNTLMPPVPAQICQFREILKQEPRVDSDGNPISYVTTVKVNLAVNRPAPQ